MHVCLTLVDILANPEKDPYENFSNLIMLKLSIHARPTPPSLDL